MERKKKWWIVATSMGTRRTLAVSRGKAVRNVKYRLVMDGRTSSHPSPRDLADMRDIEVLRVMADDDNQPPKGDAR